MASCKVASSARPAFQDVPSSVPPSTFISRPLVTASSLRNACLVSSIFPRKACSFAAKNPTKCSWIKTKRGDVVAKLGFDRRMGYQRCQDALLLRTSCVAVEQGGQVFPELDAAACKGMHFGPRRGIVLPSCPDCPVPANGKHHLVRELALYIKSWRLPRC